jgi:ADP-heptose:LPS heptosyltransferase
MPLAQDQIKRIAVFRALQLGDMLCAVPAFRVLRSTFPSAEITLIGLPWAESFVKRFSKYLDQFILFPGYPGLPEQEINPAEIVNFIASMQANNFDLLVQMQGNGSYVNPLCLLLGAKYIAGYYRSEDYCPNSDLFMLYPDQGSEIDRHLLLMYFLGFRKGSRELEFPLSDEDHKDFNSLPIPLKNQFICVHPGSRGAWRQWPPDHFAALADYCYEKGMTVVLTGLKNESELTAQVESLMKNPAIDLAGKTSLGAMGVLIRKAAMLISNCTGVSHLAAAFQTPSIVISMDGEPERWSPLNTSIHKTTNWLNNAEFQPVFEDTIDLLKNHLNIRIDR